MPAFVIIHKIVKSQPGNIKTSQHSAYAAVDVNNETPYSKIFLYFLNFFDRFDKVHFLYRFPGYFANNEIPTFAVAAILNCIVALQVDKFLLL